MPARYLHTGNHLQFFAPVGGVFSGVPIFIGDTFLIPVTNAKENEKFAGTVTGAWLLAKLKDEKIDQGVNIYWHKSTDGTASYATTKAPGNVLIGKATFMSPVGAETVEVRLNG